MGRTCSGLRTSLVILASQALIRTGDLARHLGVHVTTLCRWSQQPGLWRDAMTRRGWYSVSRLRVAGLLAPFQEPVPGPAGATPAAGRGEAPPPRAVESPRPADCGASAPMAPDASPS